MPDSALLAGLKIITLTLWMMKMNKLNDMTDLSFTQTSRAMTSTHLDRKEGNYIPWWVIVREHNMKPKQLRVTKCKNPAVFMGN